MLVPIKQNKTAEGNIIGWCSAAYRADRGLWPLFVMRSVAQLFLFTQFPNVGHQIFDFRLFQALAVGRHLVLSGGDGGYEIRVALFCDLGRTEIMRSQRLAGSRSTFSIRSMTSGALGFVGCRCSLRAR